MCGKDGLTAYLDGQDPAQLIAKHPEMFPKEVLEEHMDMLRNRDAYLEKLERYITSCAEGKELITEIPDFLPTPSQPLLVGTYSVDKEYSRLPYGSLPIGGLDYDISSVIDPRQLEVTSEEYENILQYNRNMERQFLRNAISQRLSATII